MKNKILIITAILLISCSMQAFAIENPVNKGTIDYRDFEYIIFEDDNQVNLTFVESEDFDSNALTVQKIEYYPDTNETKYKFTSEEISPEPWFIPGEKDFIYQDYNSGQLYIISVDYSGIEVPLSDEEIELIETQDNLTNLTARYGELLDLYEQLSNSTTQINETLSLYRDFVNETLEESIDNLYQEFLELKDDLDTKKDYIKNLEGLYENLTNDYNETTNNFNEMTIQYLDLKEEYAVLNESFNLTYNDLLDKGAALSEYENFKERILGHGETFYFKGRNYRTLISYQREIKKLQDEVGWTPIYVVLSVALTFLICFLLYKRQKSKEKVSDLVAATENNYPKESSILDKFSSNKLFSYLLPQKKSSKKVDKKIDIEKKENIDERFEKMNKKIDDKFEAISESIDKLISAQGELK